MRFVNTGFQVNKILHPRHTYPMQGMRRPSDPQDACGPLVGVCGRPIKRLPTALRMRISPDAVIIQTRKVIRRRARVQVEPKQPPPSCCSQRAGCALRCAAVMGSRAKTVKASPFALRVISDAISRQRMRSGYATPAVRVDHPNLNPANHPFVRLGGAGCNPSESASAGHGPRGWRGPVTAPDTRQTASVITGRDHGT
jgi:hypothetical protein